MIMKTKNNSPLRMSAEASQSERKGRLFFGFCLVVAAGSLLFSPEVFAVKEGEMKAGVTYLTGLLDNNIIPLVLLAGTGVGATVSYMKSSITPLIVSLCTAGGYGFAHKWIGTVYAVCV